jgi:hypothetical protein
MRELFMRRRTAQLCGEHLARTPQIAGASTHVPGQGVLSAKLVEDRATNTRHSVCAERQPA